MCVCWGLYVQVCACCSACVEVLGQPAGIGSPLPPCRCWGKSLVCMSPLQVLFDIDPSPDVSKGLCNSDINSIVNVTSQESEKFSDCFQ